MGSDLARRWLPAAIADRLTGEASFAGEFRTAIPLFAHADEFVGAVAIFWEDVP